MLLHFNPRSPMSVGSWGLAAFSGVATLSVWAQAARDGLLAGLPPLARVGQALPVRPLAATGAPLGFFMAGYTGVLLSNTSVPLWARNARSNRPCVSVQCLCHSLCRALARLDAERAREPHGPAESCHRPGGGDTGGKGDAGAGDARHLGPLRDPLLRGQSAPLFYGAVLCGLLLPTLLGWSRARPVRCSRHSHVGRGAPVARGHRAGRTRERRQAQAYFWFTNRSGNRAKPAFVDKPHPTVDN